eukprot:NODE_876_length_3362_cov_0.997242.p1 type:complete len:400 gc:universal NODE_876_length_3362_cov_0.997242:309-1508(+)
MSNPYLAHREKKDKEKLKEDVFDADLIHRKRSRIKFRMNEPGKYEKKAKIEKLEKRIEQRKEAALLKKNEEREKEKQHWSRVPIPDVEWWDSCLVYPQSQYSEVDPNFKFDIPVPQLATIEEPKGTIPVTHLILHPLPPREEGKPFKIPTYLTKPEIKRMRRLRRLNEQQEKRDKILLGEIVEEPKLTLKNFSKVLQSEVLVDPTKAEQMVLDQIENRKLKHEEHNESFRLTKEEKREKNIKKWHKDRKKNLQRVVYKIYKMNHKIKNKIDMNATQMQMTGVLIWYKQDDDQFALLVAEGGRIATNRIQNLLNRRIDWKNMEQNNDEMDIDSNSDDMIDDDKETEHTELLWKGNVDNSIFENKIGQFRVKLCNKESIIPYVDHIGEEMKSYWNMTHNKS